MRTTLLPLLMCSSLALADDSMTAVFLGLVPGNQVDQSLAHQYSDCLRSTMQKRGAISFIDNSTLDKPTDLLLSSGTDGCDLICQSALARSVSADYVISGILEKSLTGYRSILQISYADSALKPEKIDWQIIGNDKDLFDDGCKNGGGVIYTYLATPEAKVHLKLPEGYNYEHVRDQAINRSDVYKLVQILREKEERNGAMSKKNPDASTSGGEKRR